MVLLYYLNELKKAAVLPLNKWAKHNQSFLDIATKNQSITEGLKFFTASNEMLERSTRNYGKNEFSLPDFAKSVGNKVCNVNVQEEVVLEKPFCNLLHFRRLINDESVDLSEPRVLIVAPLSGHFATLLTDTVKSMVIDHEVYITDWVDAKNRPSA